MKNFYNREKELGELASIEQQAEQNAQMTFMVGRRRIGKTSLLLKAYEDSTLVYLFVAKKSEILLCQEFIEEIKDKLEIPVFGDIKDFKTLFELLMQVSKERSFTLVIDEFQEFQHINASIYSDIQRIWDLNKDNSHINLIFCGSIYSLMVKIFENQKEPLFGRADHKFHIQAFDIDTLKDVLKDHYPNYTGEDLLALFIFTGGIPKYVELIIQNKAFTLNSMLDTILNENSLFIDEGKNLLVDEFGKDYGNYFSILSLIASGKTSRNEIESILSIETGGFLNRLEKDFDLIKKIRPFLAKPLSKKVKYYINDNFLSFWFRFIYKHKTAVELGNTDYIKSIILRDYKMFSGKFLEKLFIEKLAKQGYYNKIGTYWEKSNQNEIDIVAVNYLEKYILFAEVKRQQSNINLELLKKKSLKLTQKFNGYKFFYKGFSLQDI